MPLELEQVRVPSLLRVAPWPCLRCLADCEPARAPAAAMQHVAEEGQSSLK